MAITVEKWRNLYQIHRKLSDNDSVKFSELAKVLGMTRRTVYNYLDDLEEVFNAQIDRKNGRFSYIIPAEIPNPTQFNPKTAQFIINDSDFHKLLDCLDVLKNFRHLPQAKEIKVLIQKIEKELDIKSHNEQEIIYTEYNNKYSGYKYFDQLYDAIKLKKQLMINYWPYKRNKDHEQASTIYGFNEKTGMYFWKINPWLLKEYNNRWQLIGYSESFKQLQTSRGINSDGIVNLALDRIIKAEQLDSESNPCPKNFHQEYDYVIGFTRGIKEKVHLWFNGLSLPYVKSKPLHWTQELIREDENGGEILLEVEINFELKQEIWQYMPNVNVLGPETLKEYFCYDKK